MQRNVQLLANYFSTPEWIDFWQQGFWGRCCMATSVVRDEERLFSYIYAPEVKGLVVFLRIRGIFARFISGYGGS